MLCNLMISMIRETKDKCEYFLLLIQKGAQIYQFRIRITQFGPALFHYLQIVELVNTMEMLKRIQSWYNWHNTEDRRQKACCSKISMFSFHFEITYYILTYRTYSQKFTVQRVVGEPQGNNVANEEDSDNNDDGNDDLPMTSTPIAHK